MTNNTWKKMALKDVAIWGSGGTPKAGVSSYYDGDIPWLVIGDLNDGYVTSAERTITDEGLQNSSAKLLDEDTVLLAMYGSIGKLGITKIKCATNQAIAFASPRDDIMTTKFLFYYLLSIRNSLISMGRGGTQMNISQSLIKPIELQVPRIQEQEKIVAKIEELFSEIDNAQESTSDVDELINAYRESLLFYSLSDMNTLSVGTEWLTKPFSEVAEVRSNLVDPVDYQNHPHIAPNNIEKNTGRLLEYRTIEEDGVKSPKHLFFEGQIVYSKIRPYLNKLIVAPFEGLCSADMYPIQSDTLDTKYLYYFMLSRHFTNQSTTAGSRSVLPKINQRELSKVLVGFPESRDVQKRIVEDIEMKLSEIENLKQSNRHIASSAKTLKQSVLSRAFKGELV